MDAKKENNDKLATPAQALLRKDVSRKEFLATLALTLVSILGFSSIIHFLTGHGPGRTTTAVPKKSGYGASSYGGKTES